MWQGILGHDSVVERFRQSLADAPEVIKRMSLIELSRAASTKYSEDFRYGRNVFSRGALMALELDQLIWKETDGKKRFRDVMRYLMTWSKRMHRPFKVSELADIFFEATGVKVDSVIERWMEPKME